MKTIFRLLLTLLLLIGGTLTSFAQPPQFSAPKDYVLVLGDSLAFGYQEAKFLTVTQDPANFPGFAADFTARVRRTAPGRNAALVNLGCPGESTDSFLTGPCVFHELGGFHLHVDYDGSQISAAEAFLAAHPGQVGPILISLAANDVFAVSNVCHSLSNQCFIDAFPALMARLSANYDTILYRLRRAAPAAEIITLGLYNPFGPTADGLVNAIDLLIQQKAAANRANFANPLAAFNPAPPQPPTLCALSFVCLAPLNDIHPTDLGYQVIADIMWEVSGYTRFEH